MWRYFITCLLSLDILGAQTLIDLRSQTREIDFRQAPSTKPLKTGSMLPATCDAGDFYFLLTAAAGENVYGCVTANTWVRQSGAKGDITVSSNGSPFVARNALNFVAGAGFVQLLTDTGTEVRVQNSVDSTVIETKAGTQSGAAKLCMSTGGSAISYTCALNPALAQYSTGMVVEWIPDMSTAGGAVTLNIDTLGARPVVLADGVTAPTAADIAAGRLYAVWFDGTAFRLQTPSFEVASASTRPACTVSLRGRLWQTFGAAGVKDETAVCAKDASDTYAWTVLY
jgi:hypothetical protein